MPDDRRQTTDDRPDQKDDMKRTTDDGPETVGDKPKTEGRQLFFVPWSPLAPPKAGKLRSSFVA